MRSRHRVLNQAVGRNRDRFPSDFMFELTREEICGISQIVTSSNLRFSKRVTVFTEQGVAILSSVLHSKRAVQVNIEIMRAFVRLRRMLASDSELSRRLNDLESKYDHQFKVVFDAIRQLMLPKQPGRKQIGFRSRSVKKQVDDACALIIGQSLLGTPQQPLVRFVLSRAIEVLFKSSLH